MIFQVFLFPDDESGSRHLGRGPILAVGGESRLPESAKAQPRRARIINSIAPSLNSLNFLIYISISVFITVYVSRTLSRNGLAFLIEGFRGNEELARSTNHLLVVGFYLVNLGFVLLRMRTTGVVDSFEKIIVYQASGVGVVLFVLGLAHFFNMYVIYSISRRGFFASETPSTPT